MKNVTKLARHINDFILTGYTNINFGIDSGFRYELESLGMTKNETWTVVRIRCTRIDDTTFIASIRQVMMILKFGMKAVSEYIIDMPVNIDDFSKYQKYIDIRMKTND